MTTSKDNKDGWHFPPDMAALLGLCFVLLPIAGLGGMIIPGILAAKHKGDLSLLWIAVGLSSIGTVLLFLARLPLYRQKKFRQIGPGGLDAFHKRLYLWAWSIIGLGLSLLVMLIILLR